MRRLMLVVVAVGCGRIGYEESSGDVDAPAPGCTMPSVFDDFSAPGDPCGAWGSPTNLVSADRFAGALHATPPAGMAGAVANCVADSFAFDAGSFVEISAVTTQPSGFVQLDAYTANHHADLEYCVDSGNLEMTDETGGRAGIASVPYDPISMRWWRLRPSDGHLIIGEYSPDGLRWTLLGTKDVLTDGTATASIVVGSGYYDTEPTASTTVFESWNVCP